VTPHSSTENQERRTPFPDVSFCCSLSSSQGAHLGPAIQTPETTFPEVTPNSRSWISQISLKERTRTTTPHSSIHPYLYLQSSPAIPAPATIMGSDNAPYAPQESATNTGSEVQHGKSTELPVRMAPAPPAPKQSLTGKQEHCSWSLAVSSANRRRLPPPSTHLA
jgi:hypothetical protein